MLIVHQLEELPPFAAPCGLTIGSFDGMHRGHQAIIERLKTLLGKGGILGVYTFSNHPSHILKNRPPLKMLTTPEHKLLLLQRMGVDCTLLFPFTQAFSQTPYDVFLNTLRDRFPFRFLVLGEGAAFGQNREGDALHITEMGRKEGFAVEYIKKISIEGEIVSSGVLRCHLEKAEIKRVAELLGRPYSIYAPCHGGKIPLKNLCHPPDGYYSVEVFSDEEWQERIAHIDGDTLQLDGPCEGMLEIVWR